MLLEHNRTSHKWVDSLTLPPAAQSCGKSECPVTVLIGDTSTISMNKTNSRFLTHTNYSHELEIKDTEHITHLENVLVDYISMENVCTSIKNTKTELHLLIFHSFPTILIPLVLLLVFLPDHQSSFEHTFASV